MNDDQNRNVSNGSEIRRVWLRFCNDIEPLLVASKNNRLLDSYIILKNKALDMVKEEKFIGELEKEYKGKQSDSNVLQALILEMRAFSSAMEISKTIEEENNETWLQKRRDWFLDQSKIVIGSAKDLLDSNSYIKNALTILGEVIDIFKVKN
jgi:hypothetical protein